jgi:hypothetical protein
MRARRSEGTAIAEINPATATAPTIIVTADNFLSFIEPPHPPYRAPAPFIPLRAHRVQQGRCHCAIVGL